MNNVRRGKEKRLLGGKRRVQEEQTGGRGRQETRKDEKERR